jgi:hypothetical protein
MNTTTGTRSAIVATSLLAAFALTACGSAPSHGAPAVGATAAARSVSDGGNPREHLAYRDLAAARSSDSNPFEHLAHRGSADDVAPR